MTLRIIISGSRTFDDYEFMEKTLDEYLYPLLPYHKIVIISGCAKGADKLGERYAAKHFIPLIRCEPLWRIHGRGAGPRRNEYMAMMANDDGCRGVLFAFWDGQSRGTKNMIQNARAEGLEIHICPFEPKESPATPS